jgi:hypothetical protein
MSKHTKDTGLALLQKNPSRDAFLEKMRSKLATTPSMGAEIAVRKREVRNRKAASWTLRGTLLLAFIAINYFFLGDKTALAAKLGFESVPSLPAPQAQMSADDQALYWTYAMYDFGKFKQRFGVSGFYAIDQGRARKNLESLLPEVSSAVLGEISAYRSVAFHSVKPGAAE